MQTPGDVKAGLTREMKLRCTITDSPDNNAPIIGRRDLEMVTTDVKEMFSIIITNNESDVASATHHDSAKNLINSTSMEVSGDVTGNATLRGYLELSWLYPLEAESGQYVCQANAVTDEGHVVVLSKTINVEVATPTTADLVNHVRDLQIERDLANATMEQANAKIGQQRAEIDQANAKIDQQRAELDQQSTKMDQANAKISQQRTEVNAMKLRLNNVEHTEFGVVDCNPGTGGHSYSDYWTGRTTLYHWGSNIYSVDIPVRFSQVYTHVPVVHLSVETMYADTNDQAILHALQVVSVDKRGFSVRCSAFHGREIYDLHVSWISVAT